MYYCKWDFCPRSFSTLPALGLHLSEDHINREQPVFVPAHARKRRPDGTWILLEETFSTDLTNSSSNPASSFPSDPNSSFMPSTASSNLAHSFIPEEKVDFDAFLRSPTPNDPGFPLAVQQSPHFTWGQPLPFPSPAQNSQATANTANTSTTAPSSNSQGVSSAGAVSPADNFAMPTQAPADKNDPPVVFPFGVATPRKASNGGVGFTWGSGK